MTVAEAQQRVSSQEFTYWRAFHRINPIGSVRSDYHAALIAFTIAKAQGSKKKPLKFDDFILQFRKKRRPSVEELTSKLMAWAGAYSTNGNNQHPGSIDPRQG
jgi:hypothetical protein